MLDYVNYYFPNILPESVLNHYGYSSRLEGNIGKSALFSRDVNIDEFDERDYNVINTTGLRGYASLKHEVMTWDDIKYLNQVRCISIEDRFYLYKMLDNETRDIIIYKAKKGQGVNIMQLEKRTEEGLMEILFQFLNSLKVTETAAMTIATYLGMNKENLITMINSIIKRYEQKGRVTEEELLKMTIMITCQKKNTQEM